MDARIPKDVVRSVFRSVWEDFYNWERAYCQSVIKTLHFSFSAARSEATVVLHNPSASGQYSASIHTPLQPSSKAKNQPKITLLDYTGTAPIATRYAVEVINAPEMSTPTYESVTPAARSIHQGDDDDSMAFIPYPDDPTFDAFEHTLRYKSFSWQDRFCDPDRKEAANNHLLRGT